MSWDWPIINIVKRKLYPDTPAGPVTPEPAPDVPAPAPQPEIPEVTPSRLMPINYIRALMILRSIPFKKIKEEILKLPLKQIAYVIGGGVWLYMTYTFICWALGRSPL